MQTPPITRLEEFCRQKGISSLTDLAKQIGASTGTFSIIKKRGARPGTKVMDMLVAKFPDLSREWVLDGIGTMFRNGQALAPVSQLPPNLPPPVPDEFQEAEPGKQIMILSYSEEKMLAGMTDAQRADYWRARYETDIEQANRREKDLLDRLTRKLKASADAATARPPFESVVSAPARRIGFGAHQDEATVLDFTTGKRKAA